jgi:cytochrome P450
LVDFRAFAMLLHHPEVQNRIHDEIDKSIGQGTQITLENRDLVPYTDAVILETLRMYPPAPFAVPHLSTEEATLAGYRLPKGQFLQRYQRSLM